MTRPTEPSRDAREPVFNRLLRPETRYARRMARIARFERPIDGAVARAVAWANMLLVDHGVFRLAYLNRHRVGTGLVWRSAQPTPHQLAWFRRQGVRTVVSLRGGREHGSWALQREACEREGLTLVDFVLRSREAPSRETVLGMKAFFAGVAYPAVMHCKSGADRAGLASALFLILHEGRPVREALAQLSPRYGHFRFAKTGILDAFFARYLREGEPRGAASSSGSSTTTTPTRSPASSAPAPGRTSSSTACCGASSPTLTFRTRHGSGTLTRMRRADLAQTLRTHLSARTWFRRGGRTDGRDRGGAGPAGRTGPRIAVIGNCQARGVVQAMGLLAPQARIDLVPMSRLGRDQRTLGAFAETLRGHDHVFSQPFAPGFFPDGGSDALRAALPGTRLFPAIVFGAFHPDAIYVGDLASMAATRLTPSPLHTYHSAIALFGHLRGLAPERIVPLYRADVFARLGYLAGWDAAAEDLLASSRAIGFDLSRELLRWIRAGSFMHTINHPRLAVLGDIAARLLTEAGLTPAPDAVESYLVDELLDGVIWPIYPAIAEVYGLPGSTTFKRRQRPGAPPALLDLAGFVAESVALYRKLPAERLRSTRLDAWAVTPDICALFDGAR